MVYGYARVSTKGQAENGNSLTDQESKLRSAGAEVVFSDAFTGTKKDRPELDKLLKQIGEGDTLIVTKLDRVARSIKCGAELIEELMDRGVTLNILNLGRLDNTPSGKLMRNVFLAFAEFERDMIVERTTEGKKVAKLDPEWREGRPKKDTPEFDKYVQLYREKKMTQVECANALGITQAAFSYRLQKLGNL